MCRDAPPIDQAGNIHFGTESGNYYIIKPTRSDDQLVLKKDLAAMIAESGFSNSSGWTAGEGKIWSSPTIGPDGTIYIGITNNTNASSSLLVALYDEGITGPAASAWPMRGKTTVTHRSTRRRDHRPRPRRSVGQRPIASDMENERGPAGASSTIPPKYG